MFSLLKYSVKINVNLDNGVYVFDNESATGKSRLYSLVKKYSAYGEPVAGYTFEDYMNYGIDNLIDKCEEMYPDIDFRYIASTAEILKRAEVYENIKIEQDPIEMYDELFKVALKQVNINNIYEPFIKFLDCLSELKDRSIIDSYFKEYTQALEQIGYFNTSHGQKIKKNISLYDEIYKNLGRINELP